MDPDDFAQLFLKVEPLITAKTQNSVQQHITTATSNHLVIQANIGNAQFSTFRTKEGFFSTKSRKLCISDVCLYY